MHLDTVKDSKIVILWMWIVFLMIALMVVVGGGTRLTGSGLSMVQWHPLMGALPPIGAESWLDTFELYKQSPQYLEVNSWMQIDDFKRIFVWEYVHRLLGRLIGLVVFFPLVYFWLKNKMSALVKKRMLIALFLGGAQGLLGWFMVKSGLSDKPEVSHYRLAAHLTLAFLVGMWVLWTILLASKVSQRRSDYGSKKLWAIAISFLTLVQIVWGAFMAGSRAGYLYSTFPDMNGALIPQSLLNNGASFILYLDDPTGIHFTHRTLAYIVVMMILATAHFLFWKAENVFEKKLAISLLVMVLFQFLLGIATVMMHVQIVVAILHQLGAFILFSLTTVHIYYYSGPKNQA